MHVLSICITVFITIKKAPLILNRVCHNSIFLHNTVKHA